ncbi:MAG: hypothetical protein U1E54_02995 [Candidatus Levybacteria bacterium]|nr:hypothetical protein [Candidatus Levybacteria bacterium]
MEINGNFTALRENGPFSTNTLPISEKYITSAKNWIKDLSSESRTKFTATRSLIFQLLNVNSFPEIQNIIKDEKHKDQVTEHTYGLLGQMYGIEGSKEEIKSKINEYAKTADSVINKLREKELSSLAAELEMVNEISSIKDPVDLLLIIFNEKYGPKARFEAKRKLVLMNLAASIDQREREAKNEIKFNKFLDFLNEHVWEGKVGETETTYILSDHDPDTFACTSFKILHKEESKKIEIKQGQKLTKISSRKFRINEREIPIYVTLRQKSKEAEILKLLRKGQENPSVAVDDDLGLFAVVESKSRMDQFQKLLVQSATKAGSSMIFEEITDTLDDKTDNPPKIKERKFHIKTGGMRIEFILHTTETYLNHLYQDHISHDEYEILRLFEKDIPELLFPKSIYEISMREAESKIIQQVRNKIRGK